VRALIREDERIGAGQIALTGALPLGTEGLPALK
jgi:hypothetical protein